MFTRPKVTPHNTRTSRCANRVLTVLIALTGLLAASPSGVRAQSTTSADSAQCAVAAASAPVAVALTGPSATAVLPDLVTVVPRHRYPARSVAHGLWTVLSAERQACGFGALTQSSRLDVEAAGHAYYLARNAYAANRHPGTQPSRLSSAETPRAEGFNAATLRERASAAGWPSSPRFMLEQATAFHTLSRPAQSMLASVLARQYDQIGRHLARRLMVTPYDMTTAFGPHRYGGLGVSRDLLVYPDEAGQQQQLLTYFSVLTASHDQRQPQRQGSGRWAHYPCSAATAVSPAWAPSWDADIPFPVSQDQRVHRFGTPIYLQADSGVRMTVHAATLTHSASGRQLPLHHAHERNDPGRRLGSHQWLLVPADALVAGDVYTVQVNGTLDQMPFSKSFNFTPTV